MTECIVRTLVNVPENTHKVCYSEQNHRTYFTLNNSTLH
jgi:hypothetical protein